MVTFTTGGTCVLDANQAGDANYTAASQVQQSFTVTPTGPGAPTGVVATAGNGQVTLSFTAPFNGGSPITQYIVGYNNLTLNPSGNPAGFQTMVFNGGSSPLTVTGLINGDSYKFEVIARNLYSNPSNLTASAKTDTIIPLAPGMNIVPAPLPSATPGAAYTSTQLQVLGVTPSVTGYTTKVKWKKVTLLPPGLKLSKTGVLSGTPNSRLGAGVVSITVQVTEKVTTFVGGVKTITSSTVQGTLSLTIT